MSQEKEKQQPVPEDAMQIPAKFSNSVNVALSQFHVRMAFGEQTQGIENTKFHTSIVMTNADALNLAHAILELEKKYEQLVKK